MFAGHQLLGRTINQIARLGVGRTDVVHGVSIDAPLDGVAAVLGHNGAGKSTLLRAAIGLLKVRSGSIPVDGWT